MLTKQRGVTLIEVMIACVGRGDIVHDCHRLVSWSST